MSRHLEDGVDRLLLGAVDEGAGVDDDDVGVFSAAGKFGSGAGKIAHHDFTIDKILGTAQADEADLLRTIGSWALRRFLLLSFGGTADSEVFY